VFFGPILGLVMGTSDSRLGKLSVHAFSTSVTFKKVYVYSDFLLCIVISLQLEICDFQCNNTFCGYRLMQYDANFYIIGNKINSKPVKVVLCMFSTLLWFNLCVTVMLLEI
jgi:hypothetical protein